jgi:hypothetical protein
MRSRPRPERRSASASKPGRWRSDPPEWDAAVAVVAAAAEWVAADAAGAVAEWVVAGAVEAVAVAGVGAARVASSSRSR